VYDALKLLRERLEAYFKSRRLDYQIVEYGSVKQVPLTRKVTAIVRLKQY